MGYSESGPSPRTARRIASELASLIERAELPLPVVLVAASSGGLSARVFASEYADRTAGLVLVDASHEDQGHEIPGIAPFVPLLSTTGVMRAVGFSLGLPPESLSPSTRRFALATRFRTAGYRAAVNELRHMRDTAAEVRASRRKLAVPLVVVTGAQGADADWRALQRDQVTLSERGCHMIAEQSGHVVPIDQPEVVVRAIRNVVDVARGRPDVPLCGRNAH